MGSALAERDRMLGELTAANAASRERAAGLEARLVSAQAIDPEAARRLRAEHAAAVGEAAKKAAAVEDLERRLEAQSERSADAMRCWTGVRDGLRREIARLGAALERQASDVQDLRQEREVQMGKFGRGGRVVQSAVGAGT